MFIDDTVTICDGKFVKATLYDSVTNPTPIPVCLTAGADYNIVSTWNVTPYLPINPSCETYGYFYPTVSGNYTIDVEFIRQNPCGNDTHYVSKTVYVEVNPSPTINPQNFDLVGSQYLCPGVDSAQLFVTGGANNVWFGPDVNGMTTDSVWIYLPGQYTVVMSLNDTNVYGCTASYNTMLSHNVSIKPQPSIVALSTLICPNDSVALNCNVSSGLSWEGPNGIIPTTDSLIYITDPGTYYVVVNDADSCDLVSNSITIQQYATPQLIANGNIFLCDDDSVEISVISNDGSLIEWQAPLEWYRIKSNGLFAWNLYL